MDKNIPTAEEFIKSNFWYAQEGNDSEQSVEMGDVIEEKGRLAEKFIEFTKLHVERALKAAAKNVRTRYSTTYPEGAEMNIIEYVDESSILNAYPLDNIK